MNTKLRSLVLTGVFTALLLVVQFATKPMGQLVTGSAVNLILIASVILGGLVCGLSVAIVSPFFAFMFGIGPVMFPLIPAIALGNLAIVLAWYFISRNLHLSKDIVTYCVAAILGAVLKFGVLYLGIVQIVIPLILKLPAEKAAVLSATFSTPQLITALVGGAIAAIILPPLKAALRADSKGK